MFFKVKDFSLQPKVLSLSNFKHKLVQICVCVSGWDNNPSVLRALYVSACYFLQGTLQQFVDDFFRSVLCSGSVVPPAVKYFFDFLDEQALRHDNVDEETLHIWKTNRWTSERQSAVFTVCITVQNPVIIDHIVEIHDECMFSPYSRLKHEYIQFKAANPPIWVIREWLFLAFLLEKQCSWNVNYTH